MDVLVEISIYDHESLNGNASAHVRVRGSTNENASANAKRTCGGEYVSVVGSEGVIANGGAHVRSVAKSVNASGRGGRGRGEIAMSRGD